MRPSRVVGSRGDRARHQCARPLLDPGRRRSGPSSECAARRRSGERRPLLHRQRRPVRAGVGLAGRVRLRQSNHHGVRNRFFSAHCLQMAFRWIWMLTYFAIIIKAKIIVTYWTFFGCYRSSIVSLVHMTNPFLAMQLSAKLE